MARLRELTAGTEVKTVEGNKLWAGERSNLEDYMVLISNCSQGGVRGGAATFFYPVWHKEFESLIVLKNNRGVEENRVRQVDYGVQLTGYFYEKLIRGEDIHFFSPHEVPGMYEAYFADQAKFKELYEAAVTETTPKLKATEVFSRILQERAGTGRIYIQNVDHCNTHSPFDPKVSPIRQSNLCVVPNTMLLTREGEFEIQSLAGQTVEVWNGEEWSEVVVAKTGQTTVVYSVYLDNGHFLDCTPEHKWYIVTDEETVEVRSHELKEGDTLIPFTLPSGKSVTDVKVDDIRITLEDEPTDTYCVNEPKRHLAVFNGILTGQCMEITLPTEPVESDGSGEIALCTLAAINVGVVDTDAGIARATELLVRALDAILDYQEYPLEQSLRSTEKYRPLGVGVINYATFLAKQGFTFSGSHGNNATHRLFESIQYHLMTASAMLAKEFGPCEAWEQLRRSGNQLPIHTYKKEVDEVHSQGLLQDWDELSKLIDEYGMRNATVSALMPSETSSQISNATNGIEPPRALVTSKQSKDGILKQVVPMLGEAQYETYWEMIKAGQEGNLEKIGIMQKFVDQTISANTGYDPNMYEGNRIPMQQMMKDLITAYRLGIKTLYYHNTRDSIDSDEDDGCDSGACKI